MANPLLTITTTDGSADTLALVGEIDTAIEAGTHRLVLDFGGVTFVNSTGLGTLVASTKRLRSTGGDLVLRHFSGIPASAPGHRRPRAVPDHRRLSRQRRR